MLRLGLVQMHCEMGAVSENLRATIGYVRAAAARGVDILAFPEASLSGYADPARYPHAVLSLDEPKISYLLAMTRGSPMTVLAGLLEKNPGGKPFITQAVVRNGELIGAYRKMTLPQNETDPDNWYATGDEVRVFHHRGLTFGVAICADLGNEAVYAELARRGAQVVFEVAAPGLYGDQATRNWELGHAWWRGECAKYLARYAQEHGIWVAVATQAGRTVDEDFPGGAYVFAPDGRCLYATPDWSPRAVYLDIDLESHRITLVCAHPFAGERGAGLPHETSMP